MPAVLEYDFEASVGHWLLCATHAYERRFTCLLAPHGITFRQAQVLAWLAMEGPQTQSEMAARMFIEPPSLVGVLDRMEKCGWIARQQCEDDRRKKLIEALPAAEGVWLKMVDCGLQMRRRATAGMTAAEVATLKRLLGILHKNVTQQAKSDSA